MAPPGVTVQRIHNVSEEQIQAAAELFTSLMKDDNGVRSLCGGDSSKTNALACAMLRAGILAGEYYEAVHEDSGMVGFLMTMPPGVDLFSTEEQRALGLTEFMHSLSEEGKQYYKTTYLHEFPTFVNDCLGPTGKTDSWYIHVIMVRPDHQNKGVATSLINTVRAKASTARDTIAMSTTTDLNAEIYQKVGFAIRGRKDMPSPWGSYPLYIFSLRD